MLKKIYKRLYRSSMCFGLTTPLFLFCNLNKSFNSIFLLIMLGSGLSILYFLILALKALPDKMPRLPLMIGLSFIFASSAFDIVNTVIHSPDLTQEGNPVVQFLFELEFSLKEIYYFSFIFQTIFVTVISVLWATFLKAYPIILKAIPSASFWKTIIFIFSGPNTSTFNFFIGKVDYFYYISSLTPVLVAGLSLYRTYLGLEWLELVPISHLFVPTVIIVICIFSYCYISYKQAAIVRKKQRSE